MGLGGLLKDFAGWTSSHGIPQVGGASSAVLRWLWAAIYLACLAMFGYQLYGILSTYFSYPVTVTTDMAFAQRDFPALTLCPANPYKASRAAAEPQLQLLLDNFTLSMESGNASLTDPLYGLADAAAVGANGSSRVGQFNRANLALQLIAAQLRAANASRFAELTFSAKEVVVECSFDGEPCQEGELVDAWDPVFGSCFHFNDEGPVAHSSATQGPEQGLRLVLLADAAEFLPLVHSAGFRVAVHSPRQQPFPDAFAYAAGVGLRTHLALKTLNVHRKDQPYGNCTFDKNDGAYFYEGDYSMEACFRSCYQEKVVKACGCEDPRLAVSGAGGALCGLGELSCLAALQKPQTDADADEYVLDSCVCPQRCDSVMFSGITSTGSWPQTGQSPEECLRPSARFANATQCLEWYGANGLVLEVSLDRLSYLSYVESPGYTVDDVVLNVGGQLGLWQGASIITVIELFSLSIIVALFCCAKRTGANVEDPDDQLIDQIIADAEKERQRDDDDGLDAFDPYAFPQGNPFAGMARPGMNPGLPMGRGRPAAPGFGDDLAGPSTNPADPNFDPYDVGNEDLFDIDKPYIPNPADADF